ncbi:YeiH family protein [Streptomyces sp. NPDC101249]|uniref:YeiH family protein n=1 Tax=Streptomyces sp. NPDC101249 TaxID=3366140 RepID=UPI0037F67382
MPRTQRQPGEQTPPARRTPDAGPQRLAAPRTTVLRHVPGLAVCAVLAAAATGAGLVAPLVGAPVIGILIGTLWRVRLGISPVLLPGVARAKGFVLQLAVVLLGTQLSLTEIAQVGASSLPVMLGTLAACLGVAYLVGRRLRIGADLRTLIGVGTAICGASAIAAVSPVIKAKSNDIAYAVSTIFLFNVAAVLVFPPLGHALGMSQSDFGLFAGTAVNDTSSVVAAASSYGHEAADHAVVVKLVRSLMIIPICLALAALVRRRETRTDPATAAGAVNPVRLVPWFLVGFLLAAAANTAGLLPQSTHAALAHTALFFITTALVGIGLSTDITELRRTGPRPVVLGLVLWATVAATSLLLQLAVG